MVTLRSIRSYLALKSFDDVSVALSFIYRAVQDAITELERLRSSRITENGGPVNFNEWLLTNSGTVQLPGANQDRRSIAVTATGTGSVIVIPLPTDRINKTTSFTVTSHTTVEFVSDGHGGWWSK